MPMSKFLILSAMVLTLTTGCSTHVFERNPSSVTSAPESTTNKGAPTPQVQSPKVASATTSPNYPAIFQKSLELLKPSGSDVATDKDAQKVNETLLIGALAANPARLGEDRATLIKEIIAESSNPDPTKHLRLIPPAGQSGYSEMKFFVDHPYISGSKTVPASNLVQVWGNFLQQARHELVLNVFDFDLQPIADILVARARAGVKVKMGIDKNTVASRPEVKAVYDKLVAGGVTVTLVNPVSLDHQKIAAIDWEDQQGARVLFSSGNLTQSCLGPEGDLVALPPDQRPADSIPNANHDITMKSWLLANLVEHELTKTIDPAYLYRGSQYPSTGSYQVTGPGVNPQTLNPYPEPSLVITFAPGGSFRNINKNLIAHFLEISSGPVRLIQFAYSSEDTSSAVLARAQREYQKNGKFDFLSVGDTPFAMQDWSQFLKMSGLKRTTDNTGVNSYSPDPESPWTKGLSADQLKDLQSKVRIAAPAYGNHTLGKGTASSTPYNAKIHHKILATGPYAIMGTSFNFSEAAEGNNEQILVFTDSTLAKVVDGMARYLAKGSLRSVFEESQRRNQFKDQGDATGGDNEDRAAKPNSLAGTTAKLKAKVSPVAEAVH